MMGKCYRMPRWVPFICALLLALVYTAPARGNALRLDAAAAFTDAAGHLERLDDAEGRLGPAQAGGSPDWRPLPGSLNAGFTRKTVWLRVPLQVDAVPGGGWMLVLGNALLDDVQVYVRRDRGDWQRIGRSGEDLPRSRWPVNYRAPVFQFEPPGPGHYTLLLRLQSKNALVTRLAVWQRLDFDNQSRREGLLYGLYFGFYLLLICLQAMFWTVTRAPMSGLFLVYMAGCVFNESMSLGLVQQISGMPVAWSDPLLGIGIACGVPLSVQVAVRLLDLASLHPRAVPWFLRSLWAVALVCSGLIALGRYGDGMQPMQSIGLLCIVVLLALGVHLLRRGHAPARFFLLAFGVFYLGVLLGFLRNLGFLPVNARTEYVSTVTAMIHMVLLSLFVMGSYERQRRQREREQVLREAELVRGQNQRLEREVAGRTAELREEVQRRGLLETELRASLEMERRVLDEQRDFFAMVSHEFRTPLAIIHTSAQQVARNLDAPRERSLTRCGNIQDAATRLLALVDDYLAEDRVGEPRSELRMGPCGLMHLIGEVCDGFPAGRVVMVRELDDDRVVTDAELLRIALRNLLANADRHAPQGGTVQVLLAAGDGDGIRIEVANAGGPIPSAERERLFQKYYRGGNARHRPGVGLGLYLVRRIAARLGGDIVLAHGDDEMVRFVLGLPRRPQA